MTGNMKAVYLRKPWARREIGTRLLVLGPNDDLRRGYVDAVRASQLLKDGFASKTKEVTVEDLANEPAPEADEEE